MRRTILVPILVACLAVVALAENLPSAPSGNDPIRLMRRPDISGRSIVFSYEGDLWIVPEGGGQAQRITTGEGVEDYPKFSPDGTWIAFSGDYNERPSSICVVPAAGGEPEQLTFHAVGGYPSCWTPDGKGILFASTQESFVRFFTKLFRVPREGGLPVELELGMGSFASYSPDGTKLAYNRHPDLFWWWKRYQGSMNQDVWIYDFKKGDYKRITDYEGNDSWPMWTGSRIYFVSDREGNVANIFYYDLDTGATKQVTRFEKRGVTWPSMSADGAKIVFERDARLYVLDTKKEEAREVVVHAPIDSRVNMVSYISPWDYLQSFDVSPSAKRMVFEARGDIFTCPAEHGDVRNLTQSSGSCDRDASWSPDGKWIAYISDKSGDDEVYLIDQMGKEEERKITSSGHFKRYAVWSPESDKLLYSTEDNTLYLLDIKGGEPKLIAKNEHRDIMTYSWSPDGAWIAYDFAERNLNRDVYFYNVKTGEKRQITTDLGDDYEPVFTPDGKYLLLLSDRVGGTYAALGRLSLLPETVAPFEFKDDEEGVGAADESKDDDEENDADSEDGGGKAKGKGKGKGEGDEAAKEKKKVEVTIDFTNIEGRIRRVPRVAGMGLHNIQVTDKYYYYVIVVGAGMFRSLELYYFDVEKLKSEKVASNIVGYGIAAKRKKVVVFDGKEFKIANVGQKLGAKKGKDDTEAEDSRDKVDVAAKTRMRLDRRAEWGQILGEAWRVVKYHFYDPNLHGVDWDEVGSYYRSLLPYVHTRRELNILLTEMVGELNASHQGVSGGDEERVPAASMAFLGAKIVLDAKTGYPRIERIYRGDKMSPTEKSPLDNNYVAAKEGDYLLAIDGHVLERGEDFNRYLIDKLANKVTITTNSVPEMKGSVETKITPIMTDGKLKYLDWANRNADFVDEKSGGRIGYMHLPDMLGGGLGEFNEKLEKFRFKDAIIIDVRFNGGGNIDERIIDVLERRPYQVTKVRGESALERPYQGFYGDIVVLINEFSFSDAEMFPAAVKARKLGTLIGKPTLGYVIAVTGHPMIDGGTVRKTFIGIWDVSTGKMIEGRGTQPDILVENTPESEKEGRDLQLEKAIEFLKESIAKNPRKFDFDIPNEKR